MLSQQVLHMEVKAMIGTGPVIKVGDKFFAVARAGTGCLCPAHHIMVWLELRI